MQKKLKVAINFSRNSFPLQILVLKMCCVKINFSKNEAATSTHFSFGTKLIILAVFSVTKNMLSKKIIYSFYQVIRFFI